MTHGTHIPVGEFGPKPSTFLMVKVVPANGLPLTFAMRDLGLAFETIAHFRLHARYVTLMQRSMP